MPPAASWSRRARTACTCSYDPVDVLANQPSLEWHLENLRSYITATNDFPGEATWRGAKLAHAPVPACVAFRATATRPPDSSRPAFLNANYPEKDGERDNVIRMLRTLEGVAMVEGAARMGNGDFEKTLYTSCFSAKTGRTTTPPTMTPRFVT